MGRLKGKAKAKKRKFKQKQKQFSYENYKKDLLSKIKKFEDPILNESCELVDEKENIKDICKLMKKVLGVCENGVGLAANQVGYSKRIISIQPDRYGSIDIMINPEILETGEEKELLIEGCLSYPNFFENVERYKEIKIRYLDEEFKEKEGKFKDFEARIIQHEIEHLDGKCFIGKAWSEKNKKDVEQE